MILSILGFSVLILSSVLFFAGIAEAYVLQLGFIGLFLNGVGAFHVLHSKK